MTREAVFDALRHRRNYAITPARIGLDFRINGHVKGEEVECDGDPQITVEVKGTDQIKEVAIIRDGEVLRAEHPERQTVRLDFADHSFVGPSYYYLRVIQADQDKHGNRSQAWSSPIWLKKKQRVGP